MKLTTLSRPFLRFAFWVKFGHTVKAAWRLMRPVEQWNDGKQAEFVDRKTYSTTSVVHA